MDSPAVVACILPVNFIKFAVIRLLQLQLDSFGRFEIEEGSITKVFNGFILLMFLIIIYNTVLFCLTIVILELYNGYMIIEIVKIV